MNKKYILIGVVSLVVVMIVGFVTLKGATLKKNIKNVEKISNYEMVCDMEMLENDELKSYQVTSTYASIEEKDYYKIELYDKSLNQSQVIVRNDSGVFVLTPSLNQAFQFQSEWPNNSPKPYIYQSLVSFLKDNKQEKVKDGYIVSGEMVYENDPRVSSQEVKFDKDLNPVYVHIYDENEAELVNLAVSSFKTDLKLSVDSFNQEALMKDAKNKYSTVASSLPLYPVALMGSSLENEKTSVIDNTTNHILKFTGDKAFTIIESAVSSNEIMEVVSVEGEMIDLLDSFAYEEDNQMTYVSSGIVSSIYSHDLTKSEMLAVLSSMQSVTVK